ncbi:hypothetical protein RvY_10586-3 [Ramazzottius varieornatus]|nr:hypothetical protein RvY_10586-3 [Ramazzottius varieornatus]
MVRSAPRVTGLSPKEGPPGTRIIVRGENLGNNAHDLLSVSICGVECVFQAEWQSPSKILCRSGNGQGLGDVVVTTKSGGRGACTVQFRGFMDAVGPTNETAVWVDDSRFIEGAGRSQPATSTGFVEGQDPLALSDEPSVCIYSEEQLLEMFGDGSGNITRENFIPAWYLLENHSGATLDDLKHGLKHMQSQTKHQGGDGPTAFLKSHLGSYFECIDTLDNLEVRFGEDSDKFLENVDSLLDRISSARDLSNRTYEAVFQRRQKIDLYRHCISTVNRFHYVFDLLSSIHKNIKTRHFRAVVTDHKKLQQLLGKSQVKGLQDVFREVEAKVNSLRNTLRDELKQMPGEPENQIQTCRNLSELGDEGDFGWECITDVHTYIMGKMLEIYSSYFTDVASAVYDLKRCLQSKIFQHIIFHIQVASPFDLEGDTFDEPIIVEPTSAHRVKHEPITSSTSICQLIRVVSEALAKSLDHLNRLCEAYFQG